MAYDAESDRVILFAGLDVAAARFPTLLDATWAYDLQANTWTKMAPKEHPSGRNFVAMAYYNSADRVILFGGDADEGIKNDTWAYDFNSDTWTELKPAKAPPPRTYSAMVYDPPSDRMILFGGAGRDEEVTNDTWAYDYKTNTWTELQPTTTPSKQGWHALVYVPSLRGIFLYPGSTTRVATSSDTWLYESGANTWSQIAGSR